MPGCIASLVDLFGQGSGNRVFDSSFVQIREDYLRYFRHAAAHKRLGESGIFGQLLEIGHRHSVR
jgi:hypothetical protein